MQNQSLEHYTLHHAFLRRPVCSKYYRSIEKNFLVPFFLNMRDIFPLVTDSEKFAFKKKEPK